MSRYKVSDVAVEINERENSPATSKYDRFVGLEHYVSGDVIIRNFGSTERLESTMKVFQNGDVLVARRNVYLKRASMVDFDGLTSGDSIVLRAKDPTIGRILPFVLNTDEFWDFADQYSDGTMSKRLSPKTLMKYEFDLPAEDELESFADLLWAANDTKESYQNLLAKTDELVKSQFIEMFGNPIEKEKDESQSRLGDLCILKAGKFVKADDIKEVQEEGLYPCYGGNGLRGYVPSFNQEGEFPLVGRQGALCGNVQYAVGRFHATEHAVVVTPKIELDRYWLYHLLCLLDLNRYASGAAQPGLAVNKLEEIRIVEPDLKLQRQYSEFAKQSDKSKFELKQNIENINSLMKSLMQQDFS